MPSCIVTLIVIVVLSAIYDTKLVLAVGANRDLVTKADPVGSCFVKCQNNALTKAQMDSECSQCCKYADRKYKSGSCKLPRRNALQKSCYCSYTEIKGNKPAKMNLCTAHCYNKRFNTATQNHYCGLCCTVMLASVKGGSCDNVGPYDWLGKRCYCVPETSTANRNVMSRSRSNGGARRRVVSV